MWDHLQTWKLFNNPRNTSPRLHLLPWLPDWDQTSWEPFPYFNRTCKWCEKNTREFSVVTFDTKHYSPTVHWVFIFICFLLAAIQLWSQSCSTRRPVCTAAQWRRWWGSAGQWCDRSLRSNCLHTDTNPEDCRCRRRDIELKKCEKLWPNQMSPSLTIYITSGVASLSDACTVFLSGCCYRHPASSPEATVFTHSTFFLPFTDSQLSVSQIPQPPPPSETLQGTVAAAASVKPLIKIYDWVLYKQQGFYTK